MKKIFLLALSILTIGSATIAQNDPAAKKVLDGVSSKLKTIKGFSANFTIKSITSKGKSNGTKTGTISIKGQKYLLKQGKTEVISDGKSVWNYDGAKTITVSGADENSKTLSPQNLLSNFYDKDFSYKLISSAGTAYEIELVPKDAKKNFKKVNIFVDKTKSIITKAKVLDKSNNTLEFAMSNLNTNATLADNLFVFNKSKYPADVEVLD